ncbi:phage GP46 family protein [Neisseriaceae bacterium ESL0693]|nr:phage GP46 family protein [Neisseriaceae bacterium ESL0693]
MDRELNSSTGDYENRTIDTLQNAVYIRLMTPKGEYWADPALGSLLHTLQREKDLNQVGMLARQYAEEALQPILDDGRATAITVSAQQPHNGELILLIQVDTENNGVFVYQHSIPVI